MSHNHSFHTRPGPRPGFRVLTGSLGRPGQIFFINQNNIVLVKKTKTKVNGLQPSFWLGLAGSTRRTAPGFFFSYFFINPARFQPRISRVSSQPTSRAEFQNYAQNHWSKFLTSTIHHPLQNVNLNYSLFFLKKKK